MAPHLHLAALAPPTRALAAPSVAGYALNTVAPHVDLAAPAPSQHHPCVAPRLLWLLVLTRQVSHAPLNGPAVVVGAAVVAVVAAAILAAVVTAVAAVVVLAAAVVAVQLLLLLLLLL